MRRLRELLWSSLWEVTPRDHRQSQAAFRRRQRVSAVVVVLGAVVLGLSLNTDPADSTLFYLGTFGLAAVWTVGAFASGPLHLGRIGNPAEPDLVAPRPVAQPILLGLSMVSVFVAGALVVRRIPWLADQVAGVLAFAREGDIGVLLLVTVINGIAEELFFRGALYAAVPRHQVAVTTAAYGVATAATGNVMLVFAAVLLGVVTGLQRRATGGILAPILTHLVWSVSMLFLLPLLF